MNAFYIFFFERWVAYNISASFFGSGMCVRGRGERERERQRESASEREKERERERDRASER